jgi:DNA-binding transcriptional LysR family regulator
MDLRHYRYFVAVADEQHFGRAAEKLHITLPPLSIQIKQLEDFIGAPLFERGKRPITLTAAGQELYPYAKSVLQQSDVAINRARQSAAGELGNITLGVTAAALLGPLPEQLNQFRLRFKAVSFVFKELVTLAQVQALENRTINLGIMRPIATPSFLVSQVFLSEPVLVALPCQHPLTQLDKIPPEALRDQPFVTYNRKTSKYFFELVNTFFMQHQLKVKAELEADQLLTVLALVGAGSGLAMVPQVGVNIQIPNVAFRPLDLESPPQAQLMLCHHEDEHSPVVHNLLRSLIS